MRLFTNLLLAAGLSGSLAHASDVLPLEKVKTGILPTGSLYSLYEVSCHDQTSASVVSVARRGRWCIQHNGELSCVRESQEASRLACASSNMAAAEEDLDAMDAFQ